MLVLHGTGDTTIPWQEGRRCSELVPSCQLALVESADHNYTQAEGAAQMIEHVVRFALGG